MIRSLTNLLSSGIFSRRFAEAAPKIIIVTFAGREKFMRIQARYIRRIKDLYPNAEHHVWNFSRNDADNKYLQTLQSDDRTFVFNQFYEGSNPRVNCIKSVGVICSCQKCRVGKWSEPYKFYASNPGYDKCIFLKLDDDIVYLDVSRLDEQINAVKEFPDRIISANVVNNGICAGYDAATRADMIATGYVGDVGPGFDWWCLSARVELFRVSHKNFFEDPARRLRSPQQLIHLPRNKFSINAIAFNHGVMKKIAAAIGEASGMGDEEIVSNTCDVSIAEGVTAAHMHFADQQAFLPENEIEQYLLRYRDFDQSQILGKD